MRHPRDKAEARAAIVRAAAAAHPGTVERDDLEAEPEIARADGRLVHAEIRSLVGAGVLSVIQTCPVNGTVLRLQATDPAAEAVAAIGGA